MKTATSKIFGYHPVLPSFVGERLIASSEIIHLANLSHEQYQQVLSATRRYLEHTSGPASDIKLEQRLQWDEPSGMGGIEKPKRYYFCLSAADVGSLLTEHADDTRIASLFDGLRNAVEAEDEVYFISDIASIGREGGISDRIARIENVLRRDLSPGVLLRTFCIAPFHDRLALESTHSAGMGCMLSEATAAIVDIVYEIEQRSPRYFDRYPLNIPSKDKFSVPVLSAVTVARFISTAVETRSERSCVLIAEDSISAEEIIRRVPARWGFNAFAVAPATDTVSSLLSDVLEAISSKYGMDRQITQPSSDSNLEIQRLKSDSTDGEALADQFLNTYENRRVQARRSLRDLPGLTTHTTADGEVSYHILGHGTQTLFLMGAFGLSSNFWQMLAATLGQHCKVVLLESIRSEPKVASISDTYYSSAEHIQNLVHAVKAVMAQEQLESVHFVTWCSGGKLGIELTRALPDAVGSLTMIAPSFAGLEGYAGSDSVYERTLHTMCKMVHKTPAMAASMAANMMKIMDKNDSDLERFSSSQKDAVEVLSLADAHHLSNLYEPFLSPENLQEFSKQLVQFRAHDIAPALAAADRKVPWMLINGSLDIATSISRSIAICQQRGNTLMYIIRGTGHYLLHQQHHIVATLIRGFVSGAPRTELPLFNPRVSLGEANEIRS